MELALQHQDFSRKLGLKEVFKAFVQYVKKPVYKEEEFSTPQEQANWLGKLLKLKVAFFPITLPLLILGLELTGATKTERNNDWELYLTIVLFAPILEELLFRATLRYNRWSISVFFVSVICLINAWTGFIEIPTGMNTMIVIFCGPIFMPLLKQFDSYFQAVWQKAFPYIFHASAIGFGLIHITNFENINNYFLAIPLIGSQLLAGYILGFARMKFGLPFSIKLHICWNFLVSLPTLVVLLTSV
jgi:membrane protease YdiL (CAAX protease family)